MGQFTLIEILYVAYMETDIKKVADRQTYGHTCRQTYYTVSELVIVTYKAWQPDICHKYSN